MNYIPYIEDTSGNTACFACFLGKYSRPVYSFIKIIQNRENTKELTPDVFINVYQKVSFFLFSFYLHKKQNRKRCFFTPKRLCTRKKRITFAAFLRDDNIMSNY